MKKSTSLLLSFLVGLCLAATFTSCVKKEYDEPETSNVDPRLVVTNSIVSLRNMASTNPTMITSDMIIAGIITADDNSGSFYKEMVIQDSTEIGRAHV